MDSSQQREQIRRGAVSTEKNLLKFRYSAVIFKAFLSKYLRYISSPARQEGILKTLQYSLWLLSRVYGQFPCSSSCTTDSVRKRHVIESLAALSGELSWTRYILRFFGFPAALEGIESGSWGSSSKWLGKAMAWTMIGFYPLEHLAYLHWKAPKVQWMPISSLNTVATVWNPFGHSRHRNAAASAMANDICPPDGRNSSRRPKLPPKHRHGRADFGLPFLCWMLLARSWSCKESDKYAKSIVSVELPKLNTTGMLGKTQIHMTMLVTSLQHSMSVLRWRDRSDCSSHEVYFISFLQSIGPYQTGIPSRGCRMILSMDFAG
jgi:hypothetical protein